MRSRFDSGYPDVNKEWDLRKKIIIQVYENDKLIAEKIFLLEKDKKEFLKKLKATGRSFTVKINNHIYQI